MTKSVSDFPVLESWQLIERLPDLYILTTLDFEIVKINAAWREHPGLQKDFQEGDYFREKVHPSDRHLLNSDLIENKDRELEQSSVEVRLGGHSQGYQWFELNFTQVHDFYVISCRTIFEERSLKDMLENKSQLLEKFFSQSLDGFFFMMLDEPVIWNEEISKPQALDFVFENQKIIKLNSAMLEQYGAKEEDMLGMTPNDFFKHDLETGKDLWRRLFDQGKLHVESHERKLDGTEIYIEGDYICIYDREKRILGHFGIQRDITKQKRSEEEIYLLAKTDSLSRLWNRKYFLDELNKELDRVQRYKEKSTVVILNIDNLKKINSEFGHITGDAVIRQVAAVLSNVRASDISARLGGDEFAILLPHTASQKSEILASRLKERIENMHLKFREVEIHFTLSIGITEIQEHDKTIDDIFSRAQVALLSAKEKGGNKIVVLPKR